MKCSVYMCVGGRLSSQLVVLCGGKHLFAALSFVTSLGAGVGGFPPAVDASYPELRLRRAYIEPDVLQKFLRRPITVSGGNLAAPGPAGPEPKKRVRRCGGFLEDCLEGLEVSAC